MSEPRNPKDAGIYEVSPGRWRVVVSKGRDGDGQYRQAVRTVRGTKTEARRVRAEMVTDLGRNEYREPANESLGTYLATWLDDIRPPHGEVKVATWKYYESHVRVHLATDKIAERRVADLTPEDVSALFRRLLDKGLSAATVGGIRRTLRAALNAHPKLKVNPVNSKRAKAPRVAPHEIDPDELWTPQDAKRFLAHAEDADPDMAVLVRLALDSGARLGELLGLTWRDIDADAASMTFRRSVSHKRMPDDAAKLRLDTPKSDKSRSVDVDTSTIAALLAMKERQSGDGVADIAGIVFRRPTRLGFSQWRLDSTTHTFQRLSKEAKLPRMPFHYLRHCCATWLLSDGMDVVAVSKRLGHWSPALTLTVYAHAIPGRQQVLARAIGDALR